MFDGSIGFLLYEGGNIHLIADKIESVKQVIVSDNPMHTLSRIGMVSGESWVVLGLADQIIEEITGHDNPRRL